MELIYGALSNFIDVNLLSVTCRTNECFEHECFEDQYEMKPQNLVNTWDISPDETHIGEY